MSYILLADLPTDYLSLPMSTYEFGRMKALEASGVGHETAKAQIYRERGPNGEPKSGPSAGDAPVPAPRATGTSWWKAGLAIGAVTGGVLLAARLVKSRSADVTGDAPTSFY